MNQSGCKSVADTYDRMLKLVASEPFLITYQDASGKATAVTTLEEEEYPSYYCKASGVVL